MGAGKSTIGRLLAKELRLPFKDSDKEIEQRTGADIPWIFDVEGEQGFREREQAVIVDLSAADGLVLATGGGAVLRAERTFLRHHRRTPALQGTGRCHWGNACSEDHGRGHPDLGIAAAEPALRLLYVGAGAVAVDPTG